ncbi:5'-3' exonuclease [Motilibacter rhizosphaerae]|uniref:5'-3' exonuclease n=1 Tax=Motilibacter rhizosphaerae TaxID=598652 RepID=A0A4Q7NB01_9ACTN|nr:5'-3' exonuclease [Motilibacter rhizosphaerae]
MVWQPDQVADRLLLLDAPSLYFRAFFGVPDTVRAPDGTPVNAVRGFLDFVARLVTDRQPTRLVAAMDADWRPAFRVAALPSYKAHRVAPAGDGEVVPDAIVPQVAVIQDCLDALGLCWFGVPGYEADDVLGTLATASRVPTEVVTGDRDLFQLVDDARKVRVLYVAAKGVGAAEVYDEARLREKYAVASGEAYAEFALLRGDPSDGLPGVPGVGEKTAAALLARYGTLAGLRAAVDAGDKGLSAPQLQRLRAASAYLDAAPVVVRVARDAPVPEHDDRLPREPRDTARWQELVERWGLGGAADRVTAALSAAR